MSTSLGIAVVIGMWDMFSVGFKEDDVAVCPGTLSQGCNLIIHVHVPGCYAKTPR